MQVAVAQPSERLHRLGWLSAGSCDRIRTLSIGAAFISGLKELGYVEGRNLVIECRSADGRPERFLSAARDLVALDVEVIFSLVCGEAVRAAREATKTVPIVVSACSDDMVSTGLAASLARPGGNVTGIQKLVPGLAGKRLELLKAAVPAASRIAVMWDPGYSQFIADWPSMRQVADKLHLTLIPVEARGPQDYEAAFAKIGRERADALLTTADPWTWIHTRDLATYTNKQRLPAMFPYHENVEAGGLMSYGANLDDLNRRAASYVDKIFKGARAADLPIEQPTQFELVVNIKTA
jgi:putative ABC transport system substrate-binding protein